MSLLLDTHVLLWWMFDDHRLRPTMREAIGDPATSIVVSAASAWEIAIKAAVGNWRFRTTWSRSSGARASAPSR